MYGGGGNLNAYLEHFLQLLTTCLDLRLGLMADVSLAPFDELDSHVVQLLKVVGRVRDLRGLVAEPSFAVTLFR